MSNSVDNVNHPDHYNQGGYECIEVMLSIYGPEVVKNFCIGNAFKYLFRCQHKNNKKEDIRKATWYLNKYDEIDARFSKSDSQSDLTKIPSAPPVNTPITPEDLRDIAAIHS
jgi:hypothetical protein